MEDNLPIFVGFSPHSPNGFEKRHHFMTEQGEEINPFNSSLPPILLLMRGVYQDRQQIFSCQH